MRWGDLRKRAISAAILAPVCLACIWLGALPWAAMLALGLGGLAAEWVHLCGGKLAAMPGLAVPGLVFGACGLALSGQAVWGAVLLLVGSLIFGLASRHVRVLALGVVYLGLPGIAMIWLRGDGVTGRGAVLFLVLVVWASDIGAYAAGRLIGGARLAPSISPGKTWSGAAGGLVAAGLVGMLAVRWYAPGAMVVNAALVAVVLGAVSQAGDLLESLIKRRFGVKDSGRLIPGHGGLLDRVDGLLAAAPAAALLALVVGRGMLLWR